MKSSNKALATEEKLTRTVTTVLDQPGQEPTPAVLLGLQQAREQALSRFDERIRQPVGHGERLALWVLRHTQAVRRSMLALSFAMVAGTGVWLAEGLLVEEEAVDAAILSHELPLEVLMDPHFSGNMHD
ncbi:hypothetical protein DLM_3735 [Aquitalea magnusonii]|jgi:hypothetical protein|uniref:Transmembrane protein n=1 Tax=Aquitalea magnusonii TaxID=332411 RepID=A0A3G9GL63_9NEIS|nr:DUF3619 family protein [Aquitalea magnusonii]BBF87319.1 hypothetical protein DLM_3735 [Aquitalea magnusonii]